MVRSCKACGVKKIRVHDIRRSHVSLQINMSFSALAIGERVGHEAEKITYGYAHLFPTVQTEMADRLNDARVLDTKEENSKGGKDDVEEKAG
jgi:integrase